MYHHDIFLTNKKENKKLARVQNEKMIKGQKNVVNYVDSKRPKNLPSNFHMNTTTAFL